MSGDFVARGNDERSTVILAANGRGDFVEMRGTQAAQPPNPLWHRSKNESRTVAPSTQVKKVPRSVDPHCKKKNHVGGSLWLGGSLPQKSEETGPKRGKSLSRGKASRGKGESSWVKEK